MTAKEGEFMILPPVRFVKGLLWHRVRETENRMNATEK